jgi:signal transduction histidine kinase
MTRRLLVSYLTITVVVLLLLEIPLAVFFQQRELNRLTVDVERDATVLATIYEDALEKDLTADAAPARSYHLSTTARVVVVDDEGISLVDTELDPDRDFSTRPEIATALTGDRATGTRFSDTLDTELLYVTVPVASGGTVHGAVRITLDTHEVTERVRKFWFGLAGIAAVILTLMAGVGSLIARSVTQPVRRLQVAAERFSSGDLTPTDADAKAPPELAALETAMNVMAARLDELIERQRSFVADASHQLRTPLTALRLRLENLQSEATGAISDELGATIDETARLSTLVDDLLKLARSERMPDPVVVDIAELLRERVDVWTATAELDDVQLELTSSDLPIGATAIPGGIEQVLDNLIDNAIRAAPPSSTVSIRLIAGSERHTISIADEGAGLSDADKSHALTRFWRSDTSPSGTGLGLAIADTIVRSSGGLLELVDNSPSGLVARFTLPAAH